MELTFFSDYTKMKLTLMALKTPFRARFLSRGKRALANLYKISPQGLSLGIFRDFSTEVKSSVRREDWCFI